MKGNTAGWISSRCLMLMAFLCLFVNTADVPVSMFGMLLSAAIQGLILTGLERLGQRSRKRRQAMLAAGFLLMLLVQGILFFWAGGYPADGVAFLKTWQGFPAAGNLILAHWRLAVLAAVFCADLSIGMTVYMHRSPAVCYLLFWLAGCSPWLLVPQPAVYLMPLATAAMLWAGRQRSRDGRGAGGKGERGLPAAAGLLLAAAVLALTLALSGWSGDRGGQGLLNGMLSWFNRLKDAFSDGTFGWGGAPALVPFSQNGWALRLQNTIYPGADRYGWYCLVIQGAWALLLTGLAAVPEEMNAKERAGFLAAVFFLPLGAAGGCMPAVIYLPWMTAQAVSGCRARAASVACPARGPGAEPGRRREEGEGLIGKKMERKGEEH